MPYTIPQLDPFTGIPTGNELAEVNRNPGTNKLPLAVLACGRQANNVTSAGTFTLGASNYGDVLVSVNGAVTVQLPSAILRLGVPASTVDIGGFAGTHNITILPFGAETIMGLASLTISVNYGAWTICPIVTGGWYQK